MINKLKKVITMKKFLTIALLLLTVLTAGAQGTWEVVHREADPMKGQDARDVYIYNAPGIGRVVVWDWEKADFRLITEKGMFRTWVSAGAVYVPVKVGFFDEDGNMEKMINVNLIPEDNQMKKYITTADHYLLGRKDIRKTISRMKSGKGYVRIVAELYNQADFDIIVYPYQK